MKNKLTCLCTLLIVLLLFSACSDDDSNNIHNPEVYFNLSVSDSSGEPINNLKVFVRNQTSGWDGFGGRPLCNIAFNVAEKSNISLKVYDLENRIVSNLIDEVLNINYYLSALNIETYPDGEIIKGNSVIFRYELTATDTLSGDMLYQESDFILRYSDFNNNYSIGNLDNEGKFTTRNSTYFPSLYNIQLDVFDYDSNPYGVMSLTNQLDIMLYDESTGLSQLYTETINIGNNNLDLVWDNPQSFRNNREDRETVFGQLWLEENNNSVYVNWSTLEEEYSVQWHVYRNTMNDFASASRINNEAILACWYNDEEFFYDYQDEDVEPETEYFYWLELIDIEDTSEFFGPDSIIFNGEPNVIPPDWSIYHYPNPFN